MAKRPKVGAVLSRKKSSYPSARAAWMDIGEKTGLEPVKNFRLKRMDSPTHYRWKYMGERNPLAIKGTGNSGVVDDEQGEESKFNERGREIRPGKGHREEELTHGGSIVLRNPESFSRMTTKQLVKAYNDAGWSAFYFPRKKQLSLHGGKRISEKEGRKRMINALKKEAMGQNNPQEPFFSSDLSGLYMDNKRGNSGANAKHLNDERMPLGNPGSKAKKRKNPEPLQGTCPDCNTTLTMPAGTKTLICPICDHSLSVV